MSQSSDDTEVVLQMQLPLRLLDMWETEIVPQLPATLDEQARALRAYQRYREIERASDLLRALLAWVLGGCSFRQLGCWAVILDVADSSEAAWRKRVRRCGEWLHWLLKEVVTPAQREAQPSQPRVILVDGTSLGQTGGTGDNWRVKLAYDLVEGRLVAVQAETVVGLPGRGGDLFVGDRGYGVRRNVIALDEMQAAALVRFSPSHCRVEQADGSLFEVVHWLGGWRNPSGSVSRMAIVSRETSGSRCACWRCVCPLRQRNRHAPGAKSKSCAPRRSSWRDGCSS